ncbi:MAG: hypothetical protein ACE14V_00375 [bacterium]
MHSQIDLKALKQKVYREINQDGLSELFIGIFFICFASIRINAGVNQPSYSYTIGFIASLLLLIFIFSFKYIREHFTYPRIGYADQEGKLSWSYIFLFVIPVAVYPTLINLMYRHGVNIWIIEMCLRWSPVFFGLLLVLYFQDKMYKSGNKLYSLFAIISVISGLVLSIIKFTYNILGIIFFWYIMGGLFFFYGLVKLIRFIYKYPRPAKPMNESGNATL